MLTRIDGHALWVYQKCLNLVSYNNDSIPDGGKIINDCILIDNEKVAKAHHY